TAWPWRMGWLGRSALMKSQLYFRRRPSQQAGLEPVPDWFTSCTTITSACSSSIRAAIRSRLSVQLLSAVGKRRLAILITGIVGSANTEKESTNNPKQPRRSIATAQGKKVHIVVLAPSKPRARHSRRHRIRVRMARVMTARWVTLATFVSTDRLLMTTNHVAASPVPTGKMPRQIPYIIGNEGCERFSFYG